jgi:biopolymer transport protein ExbB
MESQFGIANVWTQGDIVTKAVAIILLVMSLASWMVIIIKALDVIRYKRLAALARLLAQRRLRHRPEQARHRRLQPLPRAGHSKAVKPPPTTATPRPICTMRWTSATGSRAPCATASTRSPRACRRSGDPGFGRFHRPVHRPVRHGLGHLPRAAGIGSAGQATIDKVAGPIGEALIMTALGLAVAIPAVLGYNALVRGNKFVLTKLNASRTTCTPTS